MIQRLELRKYDPVVRRHVIYRDKIVDGVRLDGPLSSIRKAQGQPCACFVPNLRTAVNGTLQS